MKFEPLNLLEHDPEQYLGKTILWQGREYIVGRYLGSGAERIVHRLIDRETGGYAVVVKILRNADHRHLGDQPSDGQFYYPSAVIMAVAILEIPGGKVEIQLAAEGNQPYIPELRSDLQRAYQRYTERQFGHALEIYEDLRRRFPTNLEVLYNTGALLAEVGRSDEAFQLFQEILKADPFDLPSHIASLQCIISLGPLDTATQVLNATKELFPLAEEMRKLGVQVYRAAGEPENAREFLHDLTDEAFADLRKDISKDIKDKEEAWKQLLAAFQDSKGVATISACEQALKVYPHDPLVRVNLARAVRVAGQYEQAGQMLLAQTIHLSFQAARACILNAGFAYAMHKSWDQADRIFRYAAELYAKEIEASSWADLGGIANSVSRLPSHGRAAVLSWNEEPPTSTVTLLESMPDVEGDRGRKQLLSVCRVAALAWSKSNR